MVIKPIKSLLTACEQETQAALYRILPALGILLSKEERALRGKKLLKTVMRKWLNAADCLLEMILP